MPLPGAPHPVDRALLEQVRASIEGVDGATLARLRAGRLQGRQFFWTLDEPDRLLVLGCLPQGPEQLDFLTSSMMRHADAHALLLNPNVHPKVWAALDRHSIVDVLGPSYTRSLAWLVRRQVLTGNITDAARRKLEAVAPLGGPLRHGRIWTGAAQVQVYVDAAMPHPRLQDADLAAWMPTGDPLYDRYRAGRDIIPQPHEWDLTTALASHPAAGPALFAAAARHPHPSPSLWVALAANPAARMDASIGPQIREAARAMPLVAAYVALDAEGEAFWEALAPWLDHDEPWGRALALGILEHPECRGVVTLDPTVLQILLEHPDLEIRMATLTALARRGAEAMVVGPPLSPSPRPSSCPS